VKDMLRNAFSTAELVWEPRKSMVDSGTGVYISRPQRATAVAGVCTLALVETTTDGQFGVFTLNWDDPGKSSGSIIFDPVKIPNSSSVDLSTILTVSRG
jgi:hypothetical protein